MKNRIYMKDLKDHVGEEVNIFGFAQTIRDQNKIIFVIIRDVTGTTQTVFLSDNKETFEKVKSLTMESVVEIKGLVKEEKQAPGGFEMEAKEINILSLADPELPIPVINKGGEDTHANIRYDYRWLDLRKKDKLKIFKIWNELEKGLRKFHDEDNWMQVYTPILMGTPSESGSEVFEVKYFDTKAYLAQSPQFYKQMAIASGFEKVFVVNPVFRAEPSFTTRHVTEFTGWDFEMAYIEDHYDLMDAEEKMIISAFKQVKDTFPDLDLEIPISPFPRITMKEAKEKLSSLNLENTEKHDLNPEEEREISKIIKEETGHDFVFLTDFHVSKRPFYHMLQEDNPELTKSADLLFKGIEITTLAQREHRVDILEKQAKEKGIELDKPLQDYINFFRYGCPPHGGGGIGVARIVMKILDLPNVRDAIFLPRDVKRLNP